MQRTFLRTCIATSLCLLPVAAQADTTASMYSRREARRLERLAQRDEQFQSMADLRQRAIAARIARRKAQITRLALRNDLGDITALRTEVLQRVNIERLKVDLEPLQYNTQIETAAQAHADDMLRNGYFSHYSRTGDSFVERMKKQDYQVLHSAACAGCSIKTAYGENIAKGQRSPQEVVTAWMNSPPHKKNILSKDYEEIGIGISGVYWVQNFGTLKITKQ